ncbi:hypothetical protein MY5147_008874 [Beauveria neobassiana]
MRASAFVAAAFAPAVLAATSANVSLPAVVEFDLLFPRNETYALGSTFPFIFAMQNAELVSYMGSSGPLVLVRVSREDDYSATLAAFRPHLNYSRSNDNTKSGNENGVYFVYADMRSAILSNGTWVIGWDVTMPNCSRDSKASSAINGGVTGTTQPRYTMFTISANGKQPDFETPKDQGGDCFHSQDDGRTSDGFHLQDENHTSAGFNITDILSLDGQYGKARNFLKGMESCLTRQYLSSGYAFNNARTAFLYGQSGNTVFGFRIGKGLHSAGVGSLALNMLQEQLDDGGITAGTVAIQLLTSRAEGECRTVQVKYLEGCPELAVKCGVSGYDLESYNPGKDFGRTLIPGQHVCCSAGELPDYRPKPNPDESCKTWPVHGGDTCTSIAAENGITPEEISVYNAKTWGCNGCGTDMWEGIIICLTKGTPPMPAPVANTVCGPQVPGTKPPTDGTDISKLNPCPLNACCDVWGQCGTTIEFCTDTGTGPPGTGKKGTNGCISNCGTDIVRGSAPETLRKIGYFEGYNLARKCLNVDARLIDTSQYTHLHFGFGGISPNYEVYMPDTLTEYEFNNFKRLGEEQVFGSRCRAVRTYKKNGNTNGAPPADPRDSVTADDLLKQDITTPGFIRLPVCSPEIAFRAWDGPGGDSRLTTPNYPCVALKLPDRCSDSTFVDQTSGASPLVSDCEMMIKNLQNGDGHADHEVENAIGKQHQLDQYGSCKFGVQGKGKNGNVDFHVGGQDIVDLIRDSIDRFGGSGRVGAKGRMKCDGTVKKQDVEWGLY